MVILFGVGYFVIFVLSPENGPNLGGGSWWLQLFNGIYFSIITAASVGYGDISPLGYSKIMASIESITSLFIFAILVSKPISERQEAALYQMHKLTIDEIFTSIREGFYIMRKDFDAIVEEVKNANALSEHAKQNFETALHHGEVLIEDIPTFYNNEQQIYMIDIRRERLLAEAVERTFERLITTCNVLKAGHISFSQRAHNILHELMSISSEVLSQWRKHSSVAVHPILDRSLALMKKIDL